MQVRAWSSERTIEMVVTVQATIVSDEPPQAGAEAPGVPRDGLPWRVRAGFLSRLRVFYRACGSKGDVCGVPGSGQPAELGGGEEPGRAACGLAGACQSFVCVYRSVLPAGPVTSPRLAVPVPRPRAPGSSGSLVLAAASGLQRSQPRDSIPAVRCCRRRRFARPPPKSGSMGASFPSTFRIQPRQQRRTLRLRRAPRVSMRMPQREGKVSLVMPTARRLSCCLLLACPNCPLRRVRSSARTWHKKLKTHQSVPGCCSLSRRQCQHTQHGA